MYERDILTLCAINEREAGVIAKETLEFLGKENIIIENVKKVKNKNKFNVEVSYLNKNKTLTKNLTI